MYQSVKGCRARQAYRRGNYGHDHTHEGRGREPLRSVLMAAAAAAFLCACSSVTDVSPMGNDTYMVGGKAAGGHMSHTEVKGIALQRAEEYGRSQGKSMQLESAKSSGARGWTPLASEVVFKCI